MIHSIIAGTGMYLPEKILTNADLESIVDTSDQWIQERTGITKRHIAAENELTSDMAFHASSDALQNAKIDLAEVDIVP